MKGRKMAIKTVKTRLEISGDKEYHEKLKKINEELEQYKSTLEQLTKKYKENQNSQEALSQKVGYLKKEFVLQKEALNLTSAGLKNAQEQQAQYASQIDSAKRGLKEAKAEQKQLNKTTDEATEKRAKLSKEIKNYKKQLKEARKENNKASKAVDEWEKKHDKAQKTVNDTSEKITEYKKYLKEAKKSTDKCATSIDKYGKEVKKASNKQGDFSKKIDDSEAVVKSLAISLTASGLKGKIGDVADAIKECIKAAAEFETALAKVSTIAAANGGDMDAMKKELMALSNETGQSAVELAEVTYGALSAGMDTAEAVDFVSKATKLATGGFTDNATAVDVLTTVLNGYNMELDKAGEVSDYLIATQNLGKTTVGELAGSLGEVLPVAAAYHVEMDNLSSAMAILTGNGIATADSTTYLKSMLNDLGDRGSAVSKTLMEKTGSSFSSLMEQGYSLGDIMEILGQAVDGDKAAFNELWSSSEAGAGALSLLSAGSKGYNEVLNKMRESVGATEQAYAKMADTTAMSQQKLENAFQNLKVAVGTELQEGMRGVYEIGTDLLEWAASFVEENEWLIPVLEGVTLGIGSATVALAGFTVVTKALIPLWKNFTAALANPANKVGLVIFALVELAAVLVPLIANMINTTSEAQKQTEAWKEQAESLRESTEAYREHSREAQQSITDTRQLAETVEELAAKEGKSVAEKEAMAEAVDRLKGRMPNLSLEYDTFSDSVNMTTEELNAMLDAMERQQKYETAKSSYMDVYTERQESIAKLAEAQDALAESTERYEEVYAQFQEMSIISMTGPSEEDMFSMAEALEEVRAYTEAVDELQRAISESDSELATMTYDMNLYTIESATMTEAQRAAIDGMLEAAEAKKEYLPAYYEEIEAIAQTAQEYDRYATAVKDNAENVMIQIQELQEAYQASYQSAYENIGNQIGLFETMKLERSKDMEDMINSLGTQTEYMNEYAENIRLAMEYGVDKGILEQLTDGSAESAAILQEIVINGSERITELNEEFAKVSEGKESFASAVAELEAYYGKNMEQLVKDTEAAVKEMAMYDEAYLAAVRTCDGIIQGVDSKWSQVVSKYSALAEAAMRAYNKPMEINSPSKKFKWSAERTMEGIEAGVEEGKGKVLEGYGRLARESLEAYQQGMATVGARMAEVEIAGAQAAAWQARYLAKASGDFRSLPTPVAPTQTFNIYTPVKSPSELMRAARLEQQYGMAGE